MAVGRYNSDTRAHGPLGKPMAEARAQSDGPQDKGKSPEPQPGSSPPPEAEEPSPGKWLLSGAEPTDDSPTIISRARQTPMRPEDALADVLRGRRLAHFELFAPIGVGGMAAVIRARDTQLDRAVALKILPPEMAAD